MNITDSTKGFLKRAYEGDFDPELFSMPSAMEPSAVVLGIAEAYDELMKDYPPLELEEKGSLPDELIAKLGKIGIFGLLVPKEYGGLGLSLSEYLLVVQHIARSDIAVALTPLAHISIGIKGILLFGSEEQKRRFLPRAASGEMIFAYALTEPMVGSDAQHILTKATLSADGSHYTLTGQKTYITNGGYAGGFTVFAQMDESKPGYMGAFIVERQSEGIRVGPNMRKMGLKASSTTMVGLNEVKVPAENLLGKPGEGFKIAMTILNYGRLGLGAGSVGAMEQSLSDMLARSTSRVQFGTPIVSFELIREKLARAKAHGFAASCLTYFTAKLLEAYPLLNVAEESSHCKLYSTTRAWDSLYDALQTAGGAGYLATNPYEKRMRDARVTTVFEGTTEIHSIYPALFLARDLGKALKKAGPIGKLALMAGRSMSGPRARALAKVASLKEGALREGLAFAAENLRVMRKNTLRALAKYGAAISSREYLLRRLTSLSLDAYVLLSCAAQIEQRSRAGQDVADYLELYSYLLEEARANARANRAFKDCGVEESSRRIAQRLSP